MSYANPWRLAGASCLVLAACSAEPDRPFCEPGITCPAASLEHCAAGREAHEHGRAAFADGTCVAKDDASCRAATVTCALWGQCHAPVAAASGVCDERDDRDFAASRNPACGAGTCVAQDDDCKDAGVCRLEGRCTASGGVCVADATSCAKSELCAEIGWCSLVSGQACRPATVADCQRAEICAEQGDCALGNARCGTCSRSPECRQNGLCQRVGRLCKAIDPKHCQNAVACTREGRCRPYQGACVK